MSRRPLFTTGIPQVLPAMADILATPNAALSVLDLRSLNTEQQSYTRFLTLYAANQAESSADVVSLAWREGTGTPVSIGVETLEAGFTFGGPVKMLDRFPVRGNVQVIAAAAVDDAPLVWGYFELEGVAARDINIRPLQPGQLISPFTYAPVHIVAGEDSETVHLLNPDYFDLVTLDVISSGAEASIEGIGVSDGADSVVVRIGTGGATVRLFDGIPMMGATPASATPLLNAGAVSGGAGAEIATWGYFTRVS